VTTLSSDSHFSKGTRALLGVALALLLAGALPGCALPGPEVVLEQAVSAARAGDREAFLDCFTPRSRPVLETWWRTVDAHNPPLGRLGAGEVGLVSVRIIPSRDFEPERAVLTLEEGPDSTRLVAHRTGGMWRLDLLDSQRADTGGPSRE
jgi:hypothetical protein